jgi:hypothetical protein
MENDKKSLEPELADDYQSILKKVQQVNSKLQGCEEPSQAEKQQTQTFSKRLSNQFESFAGKFNPEKGPKKSAAGNNSENSTTVYLAISTVFAVVINSLLMKSLIKLEQFNRLLGSYIFIFCDLIMKNPSEENEVPGSANKWKNFISKPYVRAVYLTFPLIALAFIYAIVFVIILAHRGLLFEVCVPSFFPNNY